MSIPVHCSCGKSEEVLDSFAGTRVRCKACGARIEIGFAGSEVPEVAGDGAVLGYSSPRRGNFIISRERMMAGRSAYCWGGTMGAFALFFGVMAAIGGRGELLVIPGLIMMLLLASAVIYILSGVYIRRGGMAWVIVCLVLATLHGLFTGLLSLIYLAMSIEETGVLIVAAIPVLATAAFGQLDYYLIRILGQRRMAI